MTNNDDSYRVDYFINKKLGVEEVVFAPLVPNKRTKIQYIDKKVSIT